MKYFANWMFPYSSSPLILIEAMVLSVHHEIDDAEIRKEVFFWEIGGNPVPHLSVDNNMRLGKLG